MTDTKAKHFSLHNIELAAFIITLISFAALISTYAMDSRNVIPNEYVRDPVGVSLEDVDHDGLKDLVILHRDGHREVSLTKN